MFYHVREGKLHYETKFNGGGGEFEECFRVCVDFVHDRMVIWNTLENGEDSDENVHILSSLNMFYKVASETIYENERGGGGVEKRRGNKGR